MDKQNVQNMVTSPTKIILLFNYNSHQIYSMTTQNHLEDDSKVICWATVSLTRESNELL